MNGVVERIYKDGVIVAERHRYDNRLTMAVLARLDARLDRAEERGDPRLNLVARWDDYLAALGDGRRDDGLALLAPPVPSEACLEPGRRIEGPESAGPADLRTQAEDRELHELRKDEEARDADPHSVWEEQDGWWTDYPPPPGFDGEEIGAYGTPDYKRALSPEEQVVIDGETAAEDAAARKRAEALRDAFFGFGAAPEAEPSDEPAGRPA